MSLQSLDKDVIRPLLQAMWQRDLGTGEDPANGQWFENGANGDNIGLYGGLTDNADTSLQFNDSSKQYLPQSVVCNTATVDNSNGLAPQSTVQLSYSYTNSNTTTHSTTDSIKVGTGVDIKASATIFGVGADVTTKFTFDYTHTWGESSTTSSSQTFTFSQSVPINVPAGRIYQAVLTAMSQTLIVPYTATIHVYGTTETWFEDRINGHYNWMMDAASAFQNIGQWGLAGNQSSSYTANGVTQSGTVTAQQTTQFIVHIYDVTDSANSSQATAMPRMLAVGRGASAVPPVNGVLVQTIPVSGVGSPTAA